MRKIFYLGLLLCASIFTGCTLEHEDILKFPSEELEKPTPPEVEQNTSITISSVPEFSLAEKEATMQLANFNIDFLAAASKELGEENIIVSPYSASIILSMCGNIANDYTKEQIASLLGTSDFNSCNSLAAKQMSWLSKADINVEMTIANGVWFSNQFELNPKFCSIASDVYKSELTDCDFNLQVTCDMINEWVCKNTNGLIPRFFSHIDSSTLVMFVNAIYFKGGWKDKFNPINTYKTIFNGTGRNHEVDMMRRTLYTRYAETDNCRAVWLDYGAGYFSMLCVLPNNGKNIDEILSPDELKNIYDKSDSTIVYIELPKFKIEPNENIQLDDIFSNMGYPNLLSLQNTSIFTSPIDAMFKLQQRVAFEVNEKGTEASAVTSSGMCDAPETIKNPELYFDRPFLFFINEKNSNTNLLAGKIVNF